MKLKEPKYKYKQVMIIDDNELDNFINSKIIESALFSKKIYVNTNGKSALEFLENLIKTMGNDFENICPEVLFIDLNMPILDGFQFLQSLKKLNNKTLLKSKLVILTSSAHPDDNKKSKDINADVIYLNKPLTAEMLSAI
jgi:CheY-like chemotaxis protein